MIILILYFLMSFDDQFPYRNIDHWWNSQFQRREAISVEKPKGGKPFWYSHNQIYHEDYQWFQIYALLNLSGS